MGEEHNDGHLEPIAVTAIDDAVRCHLYEKVAQIIHGATPIM